MGKSDTRYGLGASGRAGCSASRAECRPARILSTIVALAVLPWISAAAWADCLELPYADVRALESLSLRDPHRALEAIRPALTATANTHHLAAVYEVQAQSYSLLELDAEARSAAAAGLKLVPDPKDAIHVLLQTVQAENVYDSEGIDKAIGELQQARRRCPP